MRCLTTALSALACLLAVPAAPRAASDTLRLRDGRQISAPIIFEDADRLTIDTADGVTVLLKKDVLARTPGDAALTPDQQDALDRRIVEQTVRIRAIYKGYLEHLSDGKRGDKQLAEARKRLWQLDDPLAIGPATRLLAQGKPAARLLLVEWLERFADDEAQVNLLALTLLDPDLAVRERATRALARISDPRIPRNLTAALASDDDQIVRNAAYALGALHVYDAVDDLIPVLTTTRKVRRLVPREELVQGMGQAYVAGIRYRVARGVAQAEPIIGVAGYAAGLGEGAAMKRITEQQVVYRTEVQEALISLTGQNFGFDEMKWNDWLAANPPPAPTERDDNAPGEE